MVRTDAERNLMTFDFFLDEFNALIDRHAYLPGAQIFVGQWNAHDIGIFNHVL